MFRRKPPVDPELKAALLQRIRVDGRAGESIVFEAMKCVHCGGVHMHACPRVKRMKFAGTGVNRAIEEVEFWPDGQWDTSHVVWAWQVFSLGEERAPTSELTSARDVTGTQEVVT